MQNHRPLQAFGRRTHLETRSPGDSGVRQRCGRQKVAEWMEDLGHGSEFARSCTTLGKLLNLSVHLSPSVNGSKNSTLQELSKLTCRVLWKVPGTTAKVNKISFAIRHTIIIICNDKELYTFFTVSGVFFSFAFFRFIAKFYVMLSSSPNYIRHQSEGLGL